MGARISRSQTSQCRRMCVSCRKSNKFGESVRRPSACLSRQVKCVLMSAPMTSRPRLRRQRIRRRRRWQQKLRLRRGEWHPQAAGAL